MALALAPWGTRCALGAALGGALSLGGLGFLDRLVTAVLQRQPRGQQRLLLVGLLRYPALVVLFAVCARLRVVEPAGLCAGVGLVPLVATVVALKHWRQPGLDAAGGT